MAATHPETTELRVSDEEDMYHQDRGRDEHETCEQRGLTSVERDIHAREQRCVVVDEAH